MYMISKICKIKQECCDVMVILCCNFYVPLVLLVNLPHNLINHQLLLQELLIHVLALLLLLCVNNKTGTMTLR